MSDNTLTREVGIWFWAVGLVTAALVAVLLVMRFAR